MAFWAGAISSDAANSAASTQVFSPVADAVLLHLLDDQAQALELRFPRDQHRRKRLGVTGKLWRERGHNADSIICVRCLRTLTDATCTAARCGSWTRRQTNLRPEPEAVDAHSKLALPGRPQSFHRRLRYGATARPWLLLLELASAEELDIEGIITVAGNIEATSCLRRISCLRAASRITALRFDASNRSIIGSAKTGPARTRHARAGSHPP